MNTPKDILYSRDLISQCRTSLQDRTLARQGSLPLKKRKITLVDDDLQHGALTGGHSSLEYPFALALIADAATSFKHPEPPKDNTKEDSTTSRQRNNSTPKESLSLSEEEEALSSPKRQYYPPLQSPLPGGCHGRTSRNHSYCRRTPCYQGSNYCKLHYQQHTAPSVQSPRASRDDGDSSTVANTIRTNNQDRRYTREECGTRCAATTTRGRECAFVAVQDSAYCHLHADYDVNPPPKRAPSAKKESSKDVGVPSSVSVSSSTSDDSLHMTSPFSPGRGSRRVTARSSEIYADSKHLLSMVATEQWRHKVVKIATGPMAGRIGTVEKWGNGWVNVNIPGVGLHNRRSFELYIHEDSTKNTAKQSHNCRSESERCVSRDSVSPSPVSLRTGSIAPPWTEKKIAPCAEKIIETPKTDTDSVTGVETPHDSSVSNDGGDFRPFPGTSMDEKVFLVPRVTPITTRSVAGNQLSTNEAMLTEDSSRQLGSLCGTATLERSRRAVHKPARYSVEQMLSPSRKRVRSCDIKVEHIDKK